MNDRQPSTPSAEEPEAQFHDPQGEVEAALAEHVNEAKAYAANHEGYMDQVAEVHAEATSITAQEAAHQQLEAARAAVASTPAVEQPPAQVHEAATQSSPLETPAAGPVATPAIEQTTAQQRTGITHQLKLLGHEIRGLFYKGEHAKPKSNEQKERP
jgi:hypothetical protein